MPEQQTEMLPFEAEVTRLLDLVSNALYSNREIFLRELISNASDASDRLRFEALSQNHLYETDPELKIHIDFDEKAGTLTIKDNGIGMNREEVINNIGTIAKSGTREFLESLAKDQVKEANLIGQFGVGFYSAFMVAEKVTLLTRRAGLPADQGVKWEYSGSNYYTIENRVQPHRGTEIILTLKEKDKEFLNSMRLRQIITQYSDHISIPILMKKEKTEAPIEWESVNRAQALWTLPRNQIQEEDYKKFYTHLAHDFDEPLLWSHNKVEGKKLNYISLLYIPSHAPFDLFMPNQKRGLKLYVKRVFIMDSAEHFLPMYLRFVKGIIDSNDLPLNISREVLQHNDLTSQIRGALTKRVLQMLSKLASDESEKYHTRFWNEFGKVLKEGIAEDFVNRETIADLLRFSSTHTDNPAQTVSLKEYVERMKEGQDKIYYVTADSFNAAKSSPHLEIFRKKGIEVLLLSDRIDEWLVAHLTDFQGKPLQSVAKGALDLNTLKEEVPQETQKQQETDFASFIKKIQESLKDKIKEARLTYRLTDSPACLVADDQDLNINMQRLLKSIGRDVPPSKPIFELNPNHAIIQYLNRSQQDTQFADWVKLLFDQAVLVEGGQLEDPASFVTLLNQFLKRLV